MRLLWIVSIGREAPTTINRVLPLSRELPRLGCEIDIAMVDDPIRGWIDKTSPPLRSFSGTLFECIKIPGRKSLPFITRFVFPPANPDDFSTFFHVFKKYYQSFEYDAVYVTKPLLGSAGVGLLLARKHKVPLILDLDDYDIHPDSHLLWNFDGIIVASRELEKLFRKYAPLYLPMSTDLELFNPSNYNLGKISPPLITWSGMMYERLKLETILEAFKLMKEDAKLMFTGKGPKKQKLINYAKFLNLGDKVIFSEWVDRAGVPTLLAKSSIGIIYLSDTLWERCKCPGKMFEYMAMELPIITTDVGEAAYMVRKAKCGIVVPPDDPQALAEAMDHLVRNPDLCYKMGKSGREYLVKEQNCELLGRRLKRYIERLINFYNLSQKRK